MCWTQDEVSGIIWFLPKNRSYEDLLTYEWIVPYDQYGVPMYSGVFQPMMAALQLNGGGRFGMAFYLSLDYPVDMPRGSMNVRSVLNQCCVCNPQKTFIVSEDENGRVTVQPTSLAPNIDHTNVTDGALSFWRAEIDPAQKGPTDVATVVNALANKSAQIRWAARCYLGLTYIRTDVPASDPDLLVSRASTNGSGAWVPIQCLSTMSRDPRLGGHLASKRYLEMNYDPGLFRIGDPALAAVVALEMVRSSKDDRGLMAVAKRRLSDAQLAEVRSDLLAILRLSPLARQKVAEAGIGWFGLTKADLDTMDQQQLIRPRAP